MTIRSRWAAAFLLVAIAAAVAIALAFDPARDRLPYRFDGIAYGHPHFQLGDDTRWAGSDWDDTAWPRQDDPAQSHPLGSHDGIYWIRQNVDIEELRDGLFQTIHTVANHPFDLYWDGSLIEPAIAFDLPGDSAEPSRRFASFQLPDGHYTQGRHLLALRLRTEPGRPFVFHTFRHRAQPDWFWADWRWRFIADDKLHFADPNWDDSAWARPAPDSFLFSRYKSDDVPEGIFWIRAGLIVTGGRSPDTVRSLIDQIQGAREIYWDGELIGRAGSPGASTSDEIPGPVAHAQPVPDRLFTPGYHQLAIRASANHPKLFDFAFIDDLSIAGHDPLRTRWRDVSPDDFESVIVIGVMLAMAVLFLFVFLFAERRAPYLLFALLCLCAAANELGRLQFEKRLFDYTSATVQAHLRPHVLAAAAIGLLLPAFALTQFGIPRTGRWLAAIAVAIMAAVGFAPPIDGQLQTIYACGALPAVGFVAWAAWRRRPGGRLILAGVIVVVVALLAEDALEHLGIGNHWASIPLFLGVLVTLTRQIGRERAEHQQSRIRQAELETIRARAEAELLKSSLQPHFLINTLTALIEWVEQEPAKGVDFIRAIERHFDLLLRASGRESIPLSEELPLCESFLEIMGYRKLTRYRLLTENIQATDTLPPLVLHTLVENGVTHGDDDTHEVTFHLLGESGPGWRRYSLLTPRATTRDRPPETSRGTGLKYVRLRLEESYPGRWSLVSGAAADAWRTVIEIKA